eukprot:scaffold22784_cov34-Tisochrysis_lutea.AAC.1
MTQGSKESTRAAKEAGREAGRLGGRHAGARTPCRGSRRQRGWAPSAPPSVLPVVAVGERVGRSGN